jgi:hypothetical protein
MNGKHIMYQTRKCRSPSKPRNDKRFFLQKHLTKTNPVKCRFLNPTA